MTQASEPAVYRQQRGYVDDLVRVLDRDQRPPTPAELEEARRVTDAAERFYEGATRSYTAWLRNPDSFIRSAPDPPPYSWPQIELRVSRPQPAEPSEEPIAEDESATRSLEELTADERTRLRKEVASHIATDEPSVRSIATRFQISRRQVVNLVAGMKSD